MAIQPQTNSTSTNGIFPVTGPILRQAREALGLSQTAAARLLGVSNQSFSTWEMGKAKPWVKHHRKLADFVVASKVPLGATEQSHEAADLDLDPELELEVPAQEIIAKRHNQTDLRFNGWELAMAQGQSAGGAECEATLYETKGGTYVVVVEYVDSGRCYATYGERDFVLGKMSLEWVAKMIAETVPQEFFDLD